MILYMIYSPKYFIRNYNIIIMIKFISTYEQECGYNIIIIWFLYLYNYYDFQNINQKSRACNHDFKFFCTQCVCLHLVHFILINIIKMDIAMTKINSITI